MCNTCRAKNIKGCISGPCCCQCTCYICSRSNILTCSSCLLNKDKKFKNDTCYHMGGIILIYYYKPKYVCIDCRKVFKWYISENIKSELQYKKNPDDYLYNLRLKYNIQKLCLEKIGGDIFNKRCPNCKKDAYLVGPTFRAPKKSDDKEWYKSKKLIKNGYIFTSCNNN